jgi:hypothetical protein
MMGIALIGIISVLSFSVISFCLNAFTNIDDRNELNYIGQMVIENLKVNDPYILELKYQLEETGEANFISDKFDNQEYSVIITKTYSSNGLIEVVVKVIQFKQGNDAYVEFKAAIPK